MKRFLTTTAIAAVLMVMVVAVVPVAGAQQEEEERLAKDELPKSKAAPEPGTEPEKLDPNTFAPATVQVAMLSMGALVLAGGVGIGFWRYKRNPPFKVQKPQQESETQNSLPDELEPDAGFSTIQTLSKQTLILLIAILVLCVYLIQRSTADIVAGQNLYLRGPQLQSWGLSFSYTMLSVIWPLVLSGCCAAFQVLVVKRNSILDQLSRARSGITTEAIDTFDPWRINLASYINFPRLMHVLSWLLIALGPLLTLIMFLGSQLVTLLRYGGSIPLRIESATMVGSPMYITDLPSGPPGGGGATASLGSPVGYLPSNVTFTIGYFAILLAAVAVSLILISDFPRCVLRYLGFFSSKGRSRDPASPA